MTEGVITAVKPRVYIPEVPGLILTHTAPSVINYLRCGIFISKIILPSGTTLYANLKQFVAD